MPGALSREPSGTRSRRPTGGLSAATGRRKPPRGPRRARLVDRKDAWTLLPLRVFLGLTLIVTGVRQMANRGFLHATSPVSASAQLRHAAHSSGFLSPLTHHAALVGAVIVIVELAIGIATALGLWARPTAAGGVALS